MEFVPICTGLALLAAAVIVCVLLERRRVVAFEERFPPISDTEFLTRCKPGTNPEIALTVRRIVAEHFAIAYERVHPSMTFIEDIGAD